MINVFQTYEYGLIFGLGKKYYSDNTYHKHTYEHMIISLDKPSTISIDVDYKCNGILIDSNVRHKVDIKSSYMLIFLIDKTSNTANQISKLYFDDKNYFIIPDNIIKKIKSIWSGYINAEVSIATALKDIFKALGIMPSPENISDNRIIDTIKYINNAEGIYENFTDKLAARAHLSKSRFCHLFKEQTGLSITRFLLSQKIFKAYMYKFRGMNLTESAIKAGFNSLSHFSETNRKTFGFTFSDFKDEINFLK